MKGQESCGCKHMAQRMAGQRPLVGGPSAASGSISTETNTAMPNDLQQGYLHLNQPGSPLPMLGLMASHNTRAAQITQDQTTASEQLMMTGAMIQRGQLPMGMIVPQQKGRR